MSDTYVFADAKEDLLRELVKQQQVANVIAALSLTDSRGVVLGSFKTAAASFVSRAVIEIVRDGHDNGQ